MRSATHPNNTPPAAQPISRIDVIAPVQKSVACRASGEPSGSRSRTGTQLGATKVKRRASNTSNPQPAHPAATTSHWYPDKPRRPPVVPGSTAAGSRSTGQSCATNVPVSSVPVPLLRAAPEALSQTWQILRTISASGHGIPAPRGVNFGGRRSFYCMYRRASRAGGCCVGEEANLAMADGHTSSRVLPVANLREFFKDALQGALAKQHLAVEDQTEHYVVNLLTLFARSEALYESTPEGARLKPLALMLAEALEARSAGDRNRNLQRLGDVSLFIAGFFAQSFARKLIDIDYHIAMGGRAYGALAHTLTRGRGRVLGKVFSELAQKFQPMVDALNEVSETSYQHTDKDILRLYEIWLKTGSRRCYDILKRLGVDPTASGGTAFAAGTACAH